MSNHNTPCFGVSNPFLSFIYEPMYYVLAMDVRMEVGGIL